MVGISTSYFAAKGFSIYESVKKAYKLGFRLIELGANHNFEKGLNTTLKKICLDFPEAIFTQHCYFPPVFKHPFLSNSAEGLTKKNRKVLEIMFKTAKVLKSKLVSFHCGINSVFKYQGTYEDFPGFKKFFSVGKIDQEEAQTGMEGFFKSPRPGASRR